MQLSKRARIPYITAIILFSSAFFIRCARPAAPMGGPLDTIAPELLSVTPANFTTNFKAKEIILEFNEYLQLKDVSKEMLISPPMNVMPITSVKGKKIVVKFPHELVLDSNTTYKIDFGRAIVDNNESNPATRVQYVFSTGDSIDNYAFSGRVVDAITGDSVINAIVLLYDAKADSLATDSTLFNGKKLSIARTDSTGVFLATNLKDMDYKAYALKDDNGNTMYEAGTDMIGIRNRTYNPANMPPFKVWIDPVRKQLFATPQTEFRIFMEKGNITQRLEEIKRPQQYQLQASFAAPDAVIDTIIIDSVNYRDIVTEYSPNRDTVNFWIDARYSHIPDSLNGKLVYIGLDTLNMPVPVEQTFKLHFILKRDEKGNIIKGNAAEETDDRTIFQKLSDWMYDLGEDADVRRIEKIKKRFEKKKNKVGIRNHRKMIKRGIIPADSVYVPFTWKKPVSPDSLKIDSTLLNSLGLDSLALDSLGMNREMLDSILAASHIDSLCTDTLRDLKISFKPTGTVPPNTKMFMTTDYPVTTIDSMRIIMKQIMEPKRTEDSFSLDDVELNARRAKDTTTVSISFMPDRNSMLRWFINAPLAENAEYEILFPSCALEDLAGNVNDSTTFKFKTTNPEETGKITVIIRNDSVGRAMPKYIMNLADSTNKIVDVINVQDTGRYTFNYLTPKKYKIRFYEDLNGNDTLDMGSLVYHREPERVATYITPELQQLITVEKKGDTEVEIHPLKLFDWVYTEETMDNFGNMNIDDVPTPLVVSKEEVIPIREETMPDAMEKERMGDLTLESSLLPPPTNIDVKDED